MDNFALISTTLTIHILAWLTPGPLFVLIIRNSLVYSRKTGFWTALGFSLGNFVHIVCAVFGISVIIQSSELAFSILKFLGAGYLLYLGIKTLLLKIETQKVDTLNKHKDISKLSAIKIGFLTNILSTGAYLFFASIFATLLSAGASSWTVFFLAIAMPLNTFVMASVLSIFFTQERVKSVYVRYQSVLNKCLGALLVLFALVAVMRK